MNTRDAMFAEVLAHPEDDVRRLAYADVVEEDGRAEDVEMAALIRTRVPCFCIRWDFAGLISQCHRCHGAFWVEHCRHEQCRAQAITCTMTPIAEDQPEQVEYYCGTHAPEYGYCAVCGSFWSGIDNFERHGLCDHCASQLEDDEDRDEDRDEFDSHDGFYS